MKKILALYYTQSGQGKQILDSVLSPFNHSDAFDITYQEIKPTHPLPFPCSSKDFMQSFPESIEGIPCEVEPLKIPHNASFDLIFLVWQPWYLSPSIPVQSFLKLPETQALMQGKPVITITGCRNMWVMGFKSLKQSLKQCGAKLVGNIVLFDKAPNLISVITILIWLMKGKKKSWMNLLPSAGVSDKDIKGAEQFGEIIHRALESNTMKPLQQELVNAGAVDVNPSLVAIEKTGRKIFTKWSKFILKKGAFGDPKRDLRLSCFKYYLLAVIFFITPFISVVRQISTLVFRKKAKAVIAEYSSLD